MKAGGDDDVQRESARGWLSMVLEVVPWYPLGGNKVVQTSILMLKQVLLHYY